MSERLLSSFYRLLRMTRRRHRLPPQPLAWFRNLLANLGDSVSIHVASKNSEPIASIADAVVQEDHLLQVRRFGCDASSPGRHAVPVLAGDSGRAARGFEELDLGRSDFDQPGLIAFKDHLGASQSTLTYYRYPLGGERASGELDVARRRDDVRLPARCGAGPGRASCFTDASVSRSDGISTFIHGSKRVERADSIPRFGDTASRARGGAGRTCFARRCAQPRSSAASR